MSDNKDNQQEKGTYKRKKYSWIVVTATVVGAIVGSGIVRHSHKWVAEGGTFAILGLLMVWVAYFVVGLAMCDNVSMMPEKGGTYAWARKTMGRFAGQQVGWLYMVGFTCLSVILSWLAYKYSLLAIIYYFPSKAALLGAMIFSIIIPMFFIGVFTFTIVLGVKHTTQTIVSFFVIKVTMWLTIVGIGLLHFDPNVAVNIPTLDTIWAPFGVGILTLFAMNGLDAVSVLGDDVHEPGKNYLKGFIIGFIIVLILYGSTCIVIFGLVGQQGAIDNIEGGIIGIFLTKLSVPSPVLLVFIVISIIGTLFINMYMVIRLGGAMAENKDFFFAKQAERNLKKSQGLTGLYKAEMPRRGIFISTLIYGLFFFLIFLESIVDPDTAFVLYVVDQLALFPFLVILFLICLTNFKAHRMGLAKKRRKEKNEYKWARGYVIPVFGMLAMGFIIVLSIILMIQFPSSDLPSPEQSYAWEFWTILGLIFPAFMVVPGLLYWVLKGRKESLPVNPIVETSGEPSPQVEQVKGRKKKEKKKKEKKTKKDKPEVIEKKIVDNKKK